MAEKMGEVYEAYDMQIESIGRGRGAIILRTDKGIRQITSLSGTDERLQQEKDFKDKMYDKGFCYIDRVIPNVDDEIVTCDRYGNPYVCREYFEGRECSFSNIRDLEKAVLNLALLHKAGRELYIEEGSRPLLKMPGNLDRKVRELRRIRNFIRDRNKKNDFEILYIKSFDYFFEQAEKCLELYCLHFKCDERWIGYCHGQGHHL